MMSNCNIHYQRRCKIKQNVFFCHGILLHSIIFTHHQVDVEVCDVPAPAVRGVLASYRDSPDVNSSLEVPGASRDSELVYFWTGLLVPAHTVLCGLFIAQAVVVDTVQGY